MLSVRAGETPGGWITFPGGTFQLDPASNINRGNGSEGISYDRVLNRWIPVDWNHISPDGRRYVVQESYGVLDVIDAATGAKRMVTMPQVNGNWYPIDFLSTGIYLSLIGGEGPADPGLWVMNPDSSWMEHSFGPRSTRARLGESYRAQPPRYCADSTSRAEPSQPTSPFRITGPTNLEIGRSN